MSKIAYVVFLTILLTITLAVIPNYLHHICIGVCETTNMEYYFYEYGSSLCGHCVPLHKFFLKTYGDKYHCFCDMAIYEECKVRMNELIREYGIPPYVPTTFVIVNNTISAIVIGEIEEKEFWDSLLKPNNSTKVPLYIGREIKKYINITNHRLFIEKYLSSCPYRPSETISTPIRTYYLIELGVDDKDSIILKDFFEKNFGYEHFIYCSVYSDKKCRNAFDKVIEAIKKTYPSLKNLTYRTVAPLTFVIVNDRISAVVSGVCTDTIPWHDLIKPSNRDKVLIYIMVPTGEKIPLAFMDVGEHKEFIEEHFSHLITKAEKNVNILAPLVSLALADSVNPCTFMVYTTMLLIVSLYGRRRMLLTGALFILAVLTGYYALGLGLVTAASFITRPIALAIAVAITIYYAYRTVRSWGSRSVESEVCPEDKCPSTGVLGKLLYGERLSLATAYTLGLVASFTLLPCSAGPYIVFALILSDVSGFMKYLYLLAYNLIFVSPLIAILFVVSCVASVEAVRRFFAEKRHIIDTIVLMLLIAVVTYIAIGFA